MRHSFYERHEVATEGGRPQAAGPNLVNLCISQLKNIRSLRLEMQEMKPVLSTPGESLLYSIAKTNII